MNPGNRRAATGKHRRWRASGPRQGLARIGAQRARNRAPPSILVVREKVRGAIALTDPAFQPGAGENRRACRRASPACALGHRRYVHAGGAVRLRRGFRAQLPSRGDHVDKRSSRSASPAELPVEQASRFELAVNLKAAKRSAFPSPAPCWCAPMKSSSNRALPRGCHLPQFEALHLAGRRGSSFMKWMRCGQQRGSVFALLLLSPLKERLQGSSRAATGRRRPGSVPGCSRPSRRSPPLPSPGCRHKASSTSPERDPRAGT